MKRSVVRVHLPVILARSERNAVFLAQSGIMCMGLIIRPSRILL